MGVVKIFGASEGWSKGAVFTPQDLRKKEKNNEVLRERIRGELIKKKSSCLNEFITRRQSI